MTQLNPKVIVTYSIKPIENVDVELKKESTIEVPVSPLSSAASSNPTVYYENLRAALSEAKTRAGAELTLWRDAVGNRETTKEVKRGSRSDSDEEAEEEPEGDAEQT